MSICCSQPFGECQTFNVCATAGTAQNKLPCDALHAAWIKYDQIQCGCSPCSQRCFLPLAWRFGFPNDIVAWFPKSHLTEPQSSLRFLHRYGHLHTGAPGFSCFSCFLDSFSGLIFYDISIDAWHDLRVSIMFPSFRCHTNRYSSRSNFSCNSPDCTDWLARLQRLGSPGPVVSGQLLLGTTCGRFTSVMMGSQSEYSSNIIGHFLNRLSKAFIFPLHLRHQGINIINHHQDSSSVSTSNLSSRWRLGPQYDLPAWHQEWSGKVPPQKLREVLKPAMMLSRDWWIDHSLQLSHWDWSQVSQEVMLPNCWK